MASPIDIARSRKLIAASLLTEGACVSKPYELANRAKVVNVLTERDGAPALEAALPQTGNAVAAAFASGGWSDAVDQVEQLRRLLDEALSIGDTLGEDAERVEKVANRRERLRAIRKEAGL